MLVTLSGPSGVGKSFCIEYLAIHLGFNSITPYTTRQPRISESEGIHYHFRNESEIRLLTKNFSDGYWAQPLGKEWYGYTDQIDDLQNSPKNWVIQCYSDIAIEIKKKNPNVMTIFLDYKTNKELKERINQRFGSDTESVLERLKHAEHERSKKELFNYCISYDNPEKIASELIKYILSIVVQTPQIERFPGPLSDSDLRKSLKSENGIRIEGADDIENNISGWSMDLTLSKKYYRVRRNVIFNKIFDLADGNESEIIKMFEERIDHKNEGILLKPNEFILASTKEKIILPSDIVCQISGRSSYARLGISIELSQILLQPGHNNIIPIQIKNNLNFPIVIYPGSHLVQAIFFRTISNSLESYTKKKNAKYLGSLEDIRSRYYLDPIYESIPKKTRSKYDWDNLLNLLLIILAILFVASWIVARIPNPDLKQPALHIEVTVFAFTILTAIVRIIRYFRR